MKKLLCLILALITLLSLAACQGEPEENAEGDGDGGNSHTSMPDYTFFVSDGELYGMNLPDGEAFPVAEEPSSSRVMMTKDGKKLFYEEDGALFCRDLSASEKDPQKLGSDVSTYYPNNAGDKVYIVNDEGTLYLHNMKERYKIDSDVDLSSLFISDDFNKILYVVSDGYERILRLKEGENEPMTLTSGITDLDFVSDDLQNIVFRKGATLYKKVGGKEQEKISSDVVNCLAGYEDGTCFFTKRADGEYSNTLCYYDGKETKEIAGAIDEPIFTDYNRPVLVCRENQNGTNSYIVVVKDTKAQLSVESIADIDSNEKGETLYYTDSYGNLYQMDVSGKEPSEPVTFDIGVTDDLRIFDNDVVYFKGEDIINGVADLYINKEKVASDVKIYSLFYDYDSKIYTYKSEDEDGTYTLYKIEDATAEKIADDVFEHYVNPDGRILLLMDYQNGKGDLYRVDGDETKLIFEGVQHIVPYSVLG